MEFKKGDKIIWDSRFGYDLGYFIGDTNHMDGAIGIDLVTGSVGGKLFAYPSEVISYNEETIKEIIKKYGYEKQFKK